MPRKALQIAVTLLILNVTAPVLSGHLDWGWAKRGKMRNILVKEYNISFRQ